MIGRRAVAFAMVLASTSCGIVSPDDAPRLIEFDCHAPFRAVPVDFEMPVYCSITSDRPLGSASRGVSVTSSDSTIVKVLPPSSGEAYARIKTLRVGTASITATLLGRISPSSVNVLANGGPRIQARPNPALMAVGGTLSNAKGQPGLEIELIDGDGAPAPLGRKPVAYTSSNPLVIAFVGTTTCSSLPFGGTECNTIHNFKSFAAGTAMLRVDYERVSTDIAVTGVDTKLWLAPVRVGFEFAKDSANVFGQTLYTPDVLVQYDIGAADTEQRWEVSYVALRDTAFRLPRPLAASDSVTLAFERWGPIARSFHSVRSRLQRDALTDTVRPLLVTDTLAIARGRFASMKRQTKLASAFARPCTDVSNSGCDSFFPQKWLTGVELWPLIAPIPLALDRDSSRANVTPADSAALWGVIHKLEEDLGVDAFLPVTRSELGTPEVGGLVTGAVLLRVDTTAATASWRSRTTSDGDIDAAVVQLIRVTDVTNPQLVTQLLLRALGFGSTCAWFSIAAAGGCTVATDLTSDDVAYIELAYLLRDAIRTGRPTTSLRDVVALKPQ